MATGTPLNSLPDADVSLPMAPQRDAHHDRPHSEDAKKHPKRVQRVVEMEPAEKAEKLAEFAEEKARKLSSGFSWPIVFWIVALHVGALFSIFYFSWQAVLLAVVMHWITGGIGICLGYHRLFTHSGFKTYAPVKWLIAWIGGLAGEGSAIHWIANHRKHHAYSDQVGDPHSPHDGAWWSHMFWFTNRFTSEEYHAHNEKWAPDVASDKVLVFLDKTFLLWHLVLGAAFYAWGYWLGGTYMAMSFLTWGMFLRLVFVLHATWFVNSASHMWGYRNYETTDDSRNLWWVALVTYGEGWHNNHHAYPRMAKHGHKWWEFDVTFLTIRLMQAVGLAWDVVDYRKISEKKS